MGQITESSIEAYASKNKGRTTLLWDSNGTGLHIILHANGQKYWSVRYGLNGKYFAKNIGKYPKVSIEEARKRSNHIHANKENIKCLVAMRDLVQGMEKKEAFDRLMSLVDSVCKIDETEH